ncbi:MAG: nuclear transport factor 2 family protein [Hyphomonadaceae bacterium]|nr:nuclear transport factor 2 family protein [Hyphomonadaceae bacterium]
MTTLATELAHSFVDAFRADPAAAQARYCRQAAPFLAPAGAAHVINLALADGDFFAVHRHFFLHDGDRGCVVMDICRVEGGAVVEHWDVVQHVPGTILHGNTMWRGAGNTFAEARALAHPLECWPDPRAEGAASIAVVDAYRAHLDQDVRGAIERWLAPDYVQHSPHIPDGAEAAIAYFLPRVGKPKPQAPYSRVIAQGDLALYHRRVVRPGGPPEGRMQVDIFRVADGRIAEHWDVMQDV